MRHNCVYPGKAWYSQGWCNWSHEQCLAGNAWSAGATSAVVCFESKSPTVLHCVIFKTQEVLDFPFCLKGLCAERCSFIHTVPLNKAKGFPTSVDS